MTHLSCRDFVEFLDDYVDGRQPDAVAERFSAHIAACSMCHDYLKTYRETIRMTRCLCDQSDEVPCSVPRQLIEAILKARKED